MFEITEVNYSTLNTESIFIGNIYDDAINKNTNVKNVFDNFPNNGPTIIYDIPFSTSILVVPAKKNKKCLQMKGKYKVLYYACVYLLIIIMKTNYIIQQEKKTQKCEISFCIIFLC